MKTNEIPLDQNIARSAYDFKIYFNNLIDLKPKNEYEFI